MTEEWRPTHHPDYEVSNFGRVRSWAAQGGDMRKSASQRRRKNPKILRSGIASHGYPTVVFGRGRTQSVHVLVATAFIGPCPEGCEVRHKDDDRTNAHATNLEYGTRADNVRDMMRRVRRKYKLVPRQVLNIRRLLDSGSTQKELAEAYGVCRMTINRISVGRSWNHVE